MESQKRNKETEMGSGDSDDEFYNVKLPCTPETSDKSKKVKVKKVYSPPRTKVQYDYKFDSSSDEESEQSGKDSKSNEPSNDDSKKQNAEESCKDMTNLPQNTFKVVEKINEELKNMKNSGAKTQTENVENLNVQNHIATSVPATAARSTLGMVSPVVVVPPPMVVPQAPVMAPMIVPSALGPMAMMQSQTMMSNMMRGGNPMGLTNSASMLVPGMIGMQGNLMGVPGGMINASAMGGLALPGNLMRIPGAGNMFRMQASGTNVLGLQGGSNMMGISRTNPNLVNVPRPVNIPPPPSNLMVNNTMMSNPGLVVVGGMVGNRGAVVSTPVTGTSAVGSNRMVNSPQGSLPLRVPPPPPFLNLRGRPPIPPGGIRWQVNPKTTMPKTGSPPISPSSSPLDRSSRDYDGDEYSLNDKDRSPSDSDGSESPPREIPNTFKNDGSFMEMFKKMTEESENNQETSKGKTEDNMPEVKIDKMLTAPYDPRFPNTNQTKHCFQHYVDFHRCVKKRGEDFEACKYFKKCYLSLCPSSWVEKWDSQVEEGIFPGRI